MDAFYRHIQAVLSYEAQVRQLEEERRQQEEIIERMRILSG